MNNRVFTPFERRLAFFAGLFNLAIGLAFFFLPELQLTVFPELHFFVWPTETAIPPVLDRFIGAIILGNAAGAIWLAFEREWARVRPMAIVATVYGTLVGLALFYHLWWLNAPSIFWLYFLFNTPFLIVFYSLFIYHDIIPLIKGDSRRREPAYRQK